jgi:capsular exopolysaccharide synthesis family protein
MQRSKYIDQEENENISQKIVSKYIPYWPVYILAVILGIAVAYVYLKFQIPIYQASATLIIKDEKKGNEESKLMEFQDPISAKKIVENEVEIIQSRRLMKDVVEKLSLYAPITEKGEYKNTSAYVTFPLIITSPNPDSLVGTVKDEIIPISFDSAKNEVILFDKDRYSLNEVVKTKYGKLIFELNKNYQKPEKSTNKFYFTISSSEGVANGMLGSLKAEPASKLSSIINLTFRDENPKRAENILDQLINSYRQFEINEKDDLAKNTLAFVQERLNIIARDLDSIQKKAQQYKSGRGAVDLSAQGLQYLQNVGINDQKLSEVNTQISVLNQVENFVKNPSNKDGIVPSTLGVSDPMLSQLMDKLYESQLEYTNLRKTVGENNPRLLSLNDQIEKIKPNILQNIQSQRQSLNAMRQNIAATNSQYNSILQTVPQKERELLDITREEQMKSNIYSFLLQKKEESEIAYASTVVNNKVVDYAHASGNPVSPKKTLITAILVFLFLGLSFAVIMIKESFTGKILYRDEVESRTSIPIIGEIAFDKSNNNIVIEKGRRSFIAEEFRKLRISLSFLGIDADHKKILVTSSISGEGKSFIATNLAISLALTGKKVVLVDMDLNNPTINKILEIDRGFGVTEYLQGSKVADEIIKGISGHEDLFFISAGSLPENPSELLSNGRAKDLLDYLNSAFDYVIIDTSPMVLVTDGYLLTGLCDATLYIVRHKYTPKMLIKRLDRNNHINPIYNPAIIFNGVKSKGFFKNNYGYGYDYVYGNKERNKEKKSFVKT